MRNRKAHLILNSFPSCCQDNTSAFTCHLITHQYTTSFLHKKSNKSFDGRNVMACKNSNLFLHDRQQLQAPGIRQEK